LIIGDRFIVSLDGTNCDMDELKGFAKRLDLDELGMM
jgi:hypothetical protein